MITYMSGTPPPTPHPPHIGLDLYFTSQACYTQAFKI